MGNVSWVSYSFSCRVKNLKCGDTTLLIGVPHTRSWRRSEKRATFTPTENLWLHGNQRVVGWFFWGVERGPFHVSCSAVCNYGGMQADRYHLTPAAPGSAIVTLWVQNWEKKHPEKAREVFRVYISVVSQRTGMNHYCSVPPLNDPCVSSMKVYSSNIFNHGSLRKPQKWDTFWWTPKPFSLWIGDFDRFMKICFTNWSSM